jgi:hypothetical protein
MRKLAKSGGEESVKKLKSSVDMHGAHTPSLLELTPSTLSLYRLNVVALTHSSAWDEIHDVFGDGHDYDWALEGEEDAPLDEEQMKPEMRYQDVRIPIVIIV